MFFCIILDVLVIMVIFIGNICDFLKPSSSPKDYGLFLQTRRKKKRK